MPLHFPTFKARLASDLAEVMSHYPGGEPFTSFGQPRKPILTYPHAVVRTSVTRENAGRSVEESYEFDVSLRLPLPDPEATDLEGYLFGAAARLVGHLAPCSLDVEDVRGNDGAYAEVGYLPLVTSVEPGSESDEEGFCSIVVSFSVRATVYQ